MVTVVRWTWTDDHRRLLRGVVAAACDCGPAAVALHQRCRRCGGPHGRPVVTVGGRPGPHVSVAHAGGLAVVAVSRLAVGVDVEPIADGDEGALRTWVRTEAVLKATGHGLDVDPSLVDVGDPASPPRLVAWRGPGRRPRARLLDLEVGTGFVAAVATLGWRRARLDAGPAASPERG